MPFAEPSEFEDLRHKVGQGGSTMRSRLYLVAGVLSLAGVGGFLTFDRTHGQSPAPKVLPPDVISPPASKGVIPAAASAPATKKPAPFDRFRKYDELSELTREIVFSTQRGMEWLNRDFIHQVNGRFVPGLDPALGRVTDDDSFIRQAQGAFALARSARLTGEEKYAVRAAQTILSLLAETPKDPANAGMRKPVQSNMFCNRVGAAAFLAMAIYELPEASPELRICGEELCQFISSQAKADGSISVSEAGDPNAIESSNLYPGPALAALAMRNRAAPDVAKQAIVLKGLVFYRKQFRASPHPSSVPWMAAACVDAYLSTKDPLCAEFAFEMTEWVTKLQYDGADRHKVAWRGGFPTVLDGRVVQSAPTIDTAAYAVCLSEACRLIRQMEQPDASRYDKYRASLTRALQFLTTLQYGEENTQHFAGHFRPALVGAFHPSHTDGSLRVDHTATAVIALCQYLIAGVDR
jgi:hypothetical protein